MTRTILLALVLAFGCGGDDDGGNPPDGGGAAADAQLGCDGVQGACLTNQGSTMFEDVRVEEEGIANLIGDFLLAEGSVQAGEPIEVAFLNAGAIRAGTNSGPPDFEWSSETARIGDLFGPGPIDEADILGWWPFPDDMVVMTLTGAQIKRSLESGVRTWADDAGLTFGPDLVADKGGELLQVAGLSYQVTCAGTTRMQIGPSDCDPFAGTCMYENADAADSVTRIAIGGQVIFDAAQGGWQDGADAREVRVIMNDFLAEGLDNHLDLKDGTARVPILIGEWNFAESLAAHLAAAGPTTLADDEGRITVVGEVGGVACNLPATCLPAHRDHENCAHL